MKPEDPSTDDVERMRHAYRAASDDVDEQPGAHVRRSVLAAAARAVDARPMDPSMSRGFASFGRRRWPLSAAALLVVSIATGLIATRALRDEPQRVSTVSATPSEAPSSPTPSTAPTREAAAMTPAAIPRSLAPRSATSLSRPQRDRLAERPKNEVDETHPQPAPTDDGESTVLLASATPPATAASMSPASSSNTATRAQSITGDEENRSTSTSSADPRRPALMRTLRAEASPAIEEKTMGPHGEAGIEPPTPEAWVARIVKMRAAGEDDAADREVGALRRRYPEFVLPREALRGQTVP